MSQMPPPPPPPGFGGPPPPGDGAGWQPQGMPSQVPPPGYGQVYQPQYLTPPPARTNGFAIASLVLALVAVIPCFWFLPAPQLLAVIFGHVGLGQIRRSAGLSTGRGLAIAGLIIGYLLLAGSALLWVLATVSGETTFEVN
jgi:hypothetical protein